MTTADVALVLEETIGLRPGSVSAAEARGIVDLEASVSCDFMSEGIHQPSSSTVDRKPLRSVG